MPLKIKAAQSLVLEANLTEFTSSKVTDVRDKSEGNVRYKVAGQITVSEAKVEPAQNKVGRFILATNVLDETELTAPDMLSKYKEQQSIERGLSNGGFGFSKTLIF